ncbi:MAG: thioredoxin family protein [Spirosomataceae bacterium]
MKTTMLIFSIVFITSLSAFAQEEQKGIQFIENDWKLAQSTAKESEKSIFIDIYTTWCKPCKQMDKFVFTKKEVGNRFNGTFVNLKIDAESEIGKKIAANYGVLSYPTYVFTTYEGELIYKVKGAMTPDQLIREATKARSTARNFRPLSELSAAYEGGERSPKIVYEYLRQKSIKEGRQPQILEEYVKVVPPSEQQTEKVLSIISKNIESLDSEGFTVRNNSLGNFEQLTDQQRESVINGITIAKKLTFKKVVETSDDSLFDRLIAAVHATSYSPNGAMAEEKQFRFDYAKISQNFVEYRKLAEEQADYLMGKSDSELSYESERAIENFKREAQARNLKEKSQQYMIMLKSLENGAAKSASYQLNELSWGYVTMAELKGDLERASRWSDRSLELFVSPANLDTKANLLYRMGMRKEAIKLEKKAIKTGKKMSTNTSILAESLKRMKKRLPITFAIN